MKTDQTMVVTYEPDNSLKKGYFQLFAEKAIDQIMGKGAIKIDLAKVNLAAGIYMAQLSVWDENMLHPFAIREEDVIRIVSGGTARYRDAVFLPEMKWEILK